MQLQVVMYSDIDIYVLDPSSKHVGCETVCAIALFLLYPALQYRLQVTNAALVTLEQG